jgi:hypothetical protein
MNILDRILLTNTTLIGYDTQNEISVQKLLRFLPSVTFFENVESNEVLEHFNSISHFRDYKLNSILDDKSVNFVVVDLATLTFEAERMDSIEPFNKAKYLRQFILQLQSLFSTLSNTDSPVQFKLILLSRLYISMVQLQSPTIHFGGSDTALYVSDLVLKFTGENLSVEKDRSRNTCITNTKQELREISIKSLFDEITTTT